jgi:hypothetical protein
MLQSSNKTGDRERNCKGAGLLFQQQPIASFRSFFRTTNPCCRQPLPLMAKQRISVNPLIILSKKQAKKWDSKRVLAD